MGEAMLRTSYSQILNSSRDFSTAICDLDGRLIAQAEHVPIHVGALPFAARAMTEFFGDDIHEGDVFLLNDPYHGGNHLPDLSARCACWRAQPSSAGPSPMRRSRRYSTAPSARPGRSSRNGRTASTAPRPCSTTTVAATTTSTSAPR